MKINWHVIHTPPRLERTIKERLDELNEVWETYIPMQRREYRTGGKTVARNVPIIAGLIFVRSNKAALNSWLTAHAPGSYLLPDPSRSEDKTMIIEDGEMERFKLFTDHAHGQLTVLRSPYHHFANNDRVKVLSGPFAGYEGFVRSIGRDNKLIFKLGNMAVALSNIMRYDLEVTAVGHREAPTATADRLIDRLIGRLQRLGFADDAHARLREMLRHIGEAGQPADYLDALTEGGDQETARRLRGLGAHDTSALLTLARHYSQCAPGSTLCDEIPDQVLRPFLTPDDCHDDAATPDNRPCCLHHASFDEWRCPIEAEEQTYDPANDTNRPSACRYEAHVGLLPRPEGGATLFANWHAFYLNYLALDQEGRATLCGRLRRYGLTAFERALTTDEPHELHFSYLPELRLYALAQQLDTAPADPAAAGCRAAAFAAAGHALCHEIMTSARLRSWRTFLQRVWIRE